MHRQTIYIYIYITIYIIYIYGVCERFARGGGRRSRGEGGGKGGEEGCLPQDSGAPLPQTALEEAKLHRRTLGLIYRFAQRDPPPP